MGVAGLVFLIFCIDNDYACPIFAWFRFVKIQSPIKSITIGRCIQGIQSKFRADDVSKHQIIQI